MSLFSEEDRPRKPVTHEVGQDLSALSLEEIDARIGLLKREIERLEEARAGKSASRQAADAFFRKPA